MDLRFHFTIDVDWAPGSESGLDGLLKFCSDFGLPASLFIAGKFAETHPHLLRDAASRGHEFGAHGWMHCVDEDEDFSVCPGEKQRQWIRLATEAVEKATSVRPVMFRAPNLWINETTFDVLAQEGYLLDSSVPVQRFDPLRKYLKYYGAPYTPYHPSRSHLARRGDSPILEVPPSSFACIPVNMSALRVLGFSLLAWAVRRLRRRSPVLVFYAHPCEFVSVTEQFISPNDPKRYQEGLGPQNYAVLEKFVRYILDLGYRPTLLSEELHADRTV